MIETYPHDDGYAERHPHRAGTAVDEDRHPAARSAAAAGPQAVLLDPRPDPFGRDHATRSTGRSGSTRSAIPSVLEVRIQLEDKVLRAFVRRSQAYASNTHIFLVWMVGTSLVLLTIAIPFLRNQITADPEARRGGGELRQGPADAARFPAARRRGGAARRLCLHPDARAHRAPDRAAHGDADRRQPRSAHHPHPLQAAAGALRIEARHRGARTSDIDDMQSMLEGYLAFARGEAAEDPGRFDLAGYFEKLAKEAKLRKRTLTTTLAGDPTIHVRPNAFARLLANVIGNSLRYAKNVQRRGHPHARLAHRHHRRRRPRHSRPRAARTSSSPSCGSTKRATSTPAAPGSALPSPATSPAAMAATSRSTTARWAACGPSCAFRPDPNFVDCRSLRTAAATNIGVARGMIFADTV